MRITRFEVNDAGHDYITIEDDEGNEHIISTVISEEDVASLAKLTNDRAEVELLLVQA